MASAWSNGTPPQVVKSAEAPEFLLKCLHRAKFEQDLVNDIAEACSINDYTALTLAGGELSVTDAADKLFLMEDEAKELLRICKNECLKIGVDFGDGSTPDTSDGPEESSTPATVAGASINEPASSRPVEKITPDLSSIAHSKMPSTPESVPPSTQQKDTPLPAGTTTKKDVKVLGTQMNNHESTEIQPPSTPAATVTAPSTPAAEVRGPASQDPSSFLKLPLAPVQPPSTASRIPRPDVSSSTPPPSSIAPSPSLGTTRSLPKPPVRSASKPDASRTPMDKPTPTPRAPMDKPTPTPRPASARPASSNARATPKENGSPTPKAVRSKSPEAVVRKPRPRSAAPVSVSQQIPAPPKPTSVPSYMRATASVKNRQKPEEGSPSGLDGHPVATLSAVTAIERNFSGKKAQSLTLGSRPVDDKTPKQPIFANIRSSLLKPTKAFLAWVKNKEEPAEAAKTVNTSFKARSVPNSVKQQAARAAEEKKKREGGPTPQVPKPTEPTVEQQPSEPVGQQEHALEPSPEAVEKPATPVA